MRFVWGIVRKALDSSGQTGAQNPPDYYHTRYTRATKPVKPRPQNGASPPAGSSVPRFGAGGKLAPQIFPGAWLPGPVNPAFGCETGGLRVVGHPDGSC